MLLTRNWFAAGILLTSLLTPAWADPGPGRRLERWMGPTEKLDEQISNLANFGIILSHDLNHGEVVICRAKWESLSPEEQHRLGQLIQTYQNRNMHHQVRLRVADSQQATNSARRSPLAMDTTAMVSLPTVRMPSEPAPSTSLRPRVAYVCTSRQRITGLQQTLHAARIEGYGLPTPHAAVQWLRQYRADLLLIDMDATENDRRMLMALMRQAGERIPVVVIAPSSQPAIAREALRSGAVDTVDAREVTPSLMARVVEHAIERHRFDQSLKLQLARLEAAVQSPDRSLADGRQREIESIIQDMRGLKRTQ